MLHLEFCATRLRANGEDRDIEERSIVDIEMSVSMAETLCEQLGEYLDALKVARLAKELEDKE